MQKELLVQPTAKKIETLGKLADQLKKAWTPFSGLRIAIPEFYRQVKEVYDLVDQFVLKVEYLESPTPEDFRFLCNLIAAVQESIKERHLLKESLQRQVARKIPREFRHRTKQAGREAQKILRGTQQILKTCQKITQKLIIASLN